MKSSKLKNVEFRTSLIAVINSSLGKTQLLEMMFQTIVDANFLIQVLLENDYPLKFIFDNINNRLKSYLQTNHKTEAYLIGS